MKEQAIVSIIILSVWIFSIFIPILLIRSRQEDEFASPNNKGYHFMRG